MINFLSIPGIADIQERLLHSVTANNLPGTLLLNGVEGGSALPVAVSLAKALVCTNLTESGGCEECQNCRLFNNHNYPDLHLSFPIERKGKESSSSDFKGDFLAYYEQQPFATNQGWRERLNVGNKQLLIPAKEADNIIHNLSLTTYSKSPRIFIVWQPELLNITSSNRLLKSLEEPGLNTYFILVSHHPEKVLGTIKSRCVSITIPEPSSTEIIQYLMNADYESDSIAKAMLYGGGSMGNALDQLQQEEAANEQYDTLIRWLRALYTGNVHDLVAWSENTARLYREQIKQFLEYTTHLFQQAVGIATDTHKGPMFRHETFSIDRFAPFINTGKMDLILHAIETGFKDIERNGNPKIILLDLSLTLTKYIGKA